MNKTSALLRQPETVIGTWRAARPNAPGLTEGEMRHALHRLDPLLELLFPAEQAWVVRSLVEHVLVGPGGAYTRLRVEGLTSLIRDLASIALMAAA